MASDEPAGGPLAGMLVLDLARVLAGPYAAMTLGDLGARVIKVERPGTGDDTRAWGPPFLSRSGQRVSTYFLALNRNKESVCLDFKNPDDHDLLMRLIARADVIVENFRPGVMAGLGLTHEHLLEINPRLVVVSITGFGHDGPEAMRPGYDQIIQGEAGLMSLTGPDAAQPTKVGIPIADVLAGMNAANGALAALTERGRTGQGKIVRTSLFSALVSAHTFQGARWLIGGELPHADGNRHPTVAPYGAYPARDGVLQIAVGNDALWRRFAPLVRLDPDDPRYRSNQDRMANGEALDRHLNEVFGERARDEWLDLLHGSGVPAGGVRSIAEVYASDHTYSQGLIVDVDDPEFGRLRLPGPAVRFDGESPRAHRAPPRLGEHTHDVRSWLDESTDSSPPPDRPERKTA